MTTTKELMKQLAAGSISIEEVAEQLRSKTYPAVKQSGSINDIDVTADPEPPKDDEIFWVGSAYIGGKITEDEYDYLSKAMGEAATTD